MAFGALAMWSAYITISLVTLLLAVTQLPVFWVLVISVLISMLNMAAIAFVIQRWVLQPIIEKTSLALLIATLGLAIVLEETARLLNNSREKWLSPLFSEPIVLFSDDRFPVQITEMQLGVTVVALILIVILVFSIRRLEFGRQWRACSEDMQMAALCGVSIGAVLAVTFMVSAVYASVAGSLVALLYGSVNFTMGTIIGLKTLFVAVIGGLRSFEGAIAGAFLLGMFETFWSAYFEIAYRDVAAFAVLLLIFILKPEGIVSEK